MSVLALIPLLGFFAYGTLIVLAQRHPRMLERRAFILYLVAAGLWSFFSFLMLLGENLPSKEHFSEPLIAS